MVRGIVVRSAALCALACSALFVGQLLLDVPVSAQAPSTPARQPAPEPVAIRGHATVRRARGRRAAVRAGAARRSPSAPAACSTASTGQMLTKQVVLDAAASASPRWDRKVRSGSRPGCRSSISARRPSLPGLIDAHSHIYNNRRPGMTSERSALIAINNAQADLRAGFTAMRDMGSHGNGYGDVDIRNAINRGDIDGPRFQVAGRGIAWGREAAGSAAAPNPLASIVDPLGRGSARGRSRARRARRGLDQALSRPAATRSRRPAKRSTC